MSMVRPTRFAGLGVMGELVHFSVSPVLRSIPRLRLPGAVSLNYRVALYSPVVSLYMPIGVCWYPGGGWREWLTMQRC
jgi:hypothetical protein